MKNKILAIIIIFAMAVFTLAGCKTNSDNENSTVEEGASDTANGSANITPLSATSTNTEGLKNKDLDNSWNESTSTVITLNGESAKVSGFGASVSGGTVTITQEGTYVISGTLAKGQIFIDVPKEDFVRIVLNGVNITADTNSAIYAASADKVLVIIADGTTNTVTDVSSYVYSDDDKEEPDAAIFSKCDLTINGAGKLIVNGNFKNGIGTKDDLVIVSGEFVINAVNDAIRGKDSVTVVDGLFDITAGSDGIQSNEEEDAEKGWIDLRGGTYNIKSANDGIQSAASLTVSGGKYDITTGGGSANAPAHAEESFRGGGMITRNWNGEDNGMAAFDGTIPEDFVIPEGAEEFFNGNGMDMENFVMPEGAGSFTASPNSTASENTSEEETESESMKALKAGTIIITGGEFVIDAEDDAIHSNGALKIEDGLFEIKTGDDGIHADGILEISGGNINIITCYEGIEGLSVTISGGKIKIISSDDGINASDGSGVDMFIMKMNMDRTTNQTPSDGAETNTSERMSLNEEVFIRITGGNIDIYAGNDGIDSNNGLYVDGGVIKVSGPSMVMDGAFDSDGEMIVTGGEIITAGSIEDVSHESTQPVILISYKEQQVSGSVITVKDAEKNILLEYTSKTQYSMSGFSSPSFKTGETYSLYIDGEKRIDITLTDIVTSISDDGSAYNGQGMGGRSGMPNQGKRRNMPNRGNLPNQSEKSGGSNNSDQDNITDSNN